MPKNPQKVILCAGTNNIKSTSTWGAQLIASSIVDFTRYLLKTYPYIELAVMGLLPMREHSKSRQAVSINNTLRFKLPLGVCFHLPSSMTRAIVTINCSAQGKFISIMLVIKFSLNPFIHLSFLTHHTGDSASNLSTPNDDAISETEFRWNGESLNLS